MIYFDFFQGASGDMLVSALLDLKKDRAGFKKELRKLGLKTEININSVKKNGIKCAKIEFIVKDKVNFKKYDEVRKFIQKSKLSASIKKKILNTYELIFKAEAAVHGIDYRKVHLHELASSRTMLEIAAYHILTKGEEVICGVLPLGSGTKKTAHGEIPLPSPVTAEILKGFPVKLTEEKKEMVTPTAAALIKISAGTGTFSAIRKTGYGAGQYSMLRVFEADCAGAREMLQIEFDVDDMTAEDISHAAGLLRKKAADVCVGPVIMKKGRPGSRISIVCSGRNFNEIQKIIFTFTTTSGFRYWNINRIVLPRKITEFMSSHGKCRVKEVRLPGGSRVKPEFEDLAGISLKKNISVDGLRRDVIEEFSDE